MKITAHIVVTSALFGAGWLTKIFDTPTQMRTWATLKTLAFPVRREFYTAHEELRDVIAVPKATSKSPSNRRGRANNE